MCWVPLADLRPNRCNIRMSAHFARLKLPPKSAGMEAALFPFYDAAGWLQRHLWDPHPG